jgi:hypothetical protein
LYSFVLFNFILNCNYSHGSSSREVEYQISKHEDMSSTSLLSYSSFHFSPERPPKTFGKPPETSGKSSIIPKKAENYRNSTVFMQTPNRKHIPLHRQFGLVPSDYMYGIHRPEF